MRRLVAGAFALLVLAGCGSDDPTDPFTTEVIVDGLDRPTQLFVADDAWFVGVLNGAEEDGTGQVLRLDPTDLAADPVVVVDGLSKPTGVAVFAGDLWVMEERRLTRGPIDGGPRTVVVDDLAFNGRSQGTLTVDGDRLLFDTSGSSRRTPTMAGDSPVEISGALWAVDAAGEIEQVAWGFKHAYAHVRDDDGVLWTTEMSDGTYDDLPARDEVVAVREGVGHGWPACVDDNRPVVESGLEAPCDGVPGSLVTFDPGATPTGIAVAPWDRELLVVALWVEQRLVTVPRTGDGGPTALEVVFERPQHLVEDGGRLLVTDHRAGTVVALEAR